MKLLSIFSTTGLVFACVVAFMRPEVHATVTTSCRSTASLCHTQEKVLYHQTMTPSWLEKYASHIDSSHSKTKEQLTFNAGALDHGALLRVPIIPAGVLQHSAPLTVKIVVANDVSIGKTEDSDTIYGVSDGISFLGFHTEDKENYNNFAPWYGVEGNSGTNLTGIRWIGHSSPRPSDSFYPGQYVFTLKLDERWGSCYIAHDGGVVKTADYKSRLMLSKGLTFEVYKNHKRERVGIKYIEVSIIQDA